MVQWQQRHNYITNHHLKQIIPKIRPILEDTRDLLCHKQNLEILENAKLVSFDVVGLYPHIQFKERMKILQVFLYETQDKSVSTSCLFQLATFELKKSYFEPDEKMYYQKTGIAIVAELILPYTNTFMANLEK